jgi:hypothetical protein
VIVKLDYQKASELAQNTEYSDAIVIATCSSERNGIIGMGGAIRDYTTTAVSQNIDPIAKFTTTLGPRDRFNLVVAKLSAIAKALQNLVDRACNRTFIILSSNLAALQAVKQPKHQSGQYILWQIYEFAHKLRTEGNRISAIWVPSQEETTLKARAKKAAKQATAVGRVGGWKIGSKSTILGVTL